MKTIVTVEEYNATDSDYKDLIFDKMGNAWDIKGMEFVEEGFALLLSISPAGWSLKGFESLGMTPIEELDLLRMKDLFDHRS
jgi:hypothetical protein